MDVLGSSDEETLRDAGLAFTPSDTQVANLASLVECDPAVCRRALEMARGDTTAAIQLIFDKRVGAAAAARSRGRAGPSRPLPSQELFASDDEAVMARGRQRLQAAQRAHLAPEMPLPKPKRARTTRRGAADDDGPWKPFEADGVGGEAWARRLLRKVPPCLSLRGVEATTGPVKRLAYQGTVHEATDTMPPMLSGDSDEVDGGQDKDSLQSEFKGLLSDVRYPPSALQCSWRLRLPAVPEDLIGDIPPRPFELRSNADSAPASQPPHFAQHPLRPEQLKSLGWMLEQEGGRGLGPFQVEWRRYWTTKPESVEENASMSQAARGMRVTISPRDLPKAKTTCAIKSVQRNSVTVSWPSGDNTVCLVSMIDGPAFAEGVDGIPKLLPLELGCLVRVRRTVSTPKYGWGNVDHDCLGVVKSLLGPDVTVLFDQSVRARSWHGLQEEMERVSLDLESKRSSMLPELRVQATYDVRGGILGDKIGFGKTATTIGLIDTTSASPLLEVPAVDRGRFIPAKGTLVIVPSNLFEQWLNEISKFTWDGQNLKKRMSAGWSPAGCPLKVFAACDVRAVAAAKASDLAEADVVLCSYRLLYSQVYLKRRREVVSCWTQEAYAEETSLHKLELVTESLMQGTGQAVVPSGKWSASESDDRCYASNWRELKFPLLEMFYWRRVVFDEFHELESFESAQQNILQHLRSHFRWGLTGTPPVDTTAGGIFMSSLFRIDIIGGGPRWLKNGCRPSLREFERDYLVTAHAEDFVGHYVRQNVADLPHIRVEHSTVLVTHSAEERAVYLGQLHDSPAQSDVSISSPDSRVTASAFEALERLLKLCSHFQPGGETSSDAKEECNRLGQKRVKRVATARGRLERGCRILRLLHVKADGLSRSLPTGPVPNARLSSVIEAVARLVKRAGDWQRSTTAVAQALRSQGEGETGASAKTAEALQEVLAALGGEDEEQRARAMEGVRPAGEALLAALGPPDPRRGYSRECWGAFGARPTSQASEDSDNTGRAGAALAQIVEEQHAEVTSALQELKDALRSHQFFQQALAALEDSAEARSCSVCLEDDLPLTKLAITPCAHTFCIDCLTATVQQFKSCSICRQQLGPGDVAPVQLELASSAAAASAGSSSSSSAAAPPPAPEGAPPQDERLRRYGAKLALLVGRLRELRQADPTAKVILFVQFDDLKRKVAGALAEFGVPSATLHGSVSQRGCIINDWQNNAASSTFVLLLSLAQSASGTNLTAASHVVFLHPMLAETADVAVGYEEQAIGRARRHGQPRDVVHVWRFVTEGTVEQSISDRNAAALAARAAGEAPRAPAPVASEARPGRDGGRGRGRGRGGRGSRGSRGQQRPEDIAEDVAAVEAAAQAELW